MLLKRIKSFAFLSITTAACILKRGSGFASPFFAFARHGRALTGASPEHAQIVGSV